MAKRETRNGLTAMVLFTVVAGMVGLAFASVPLYRLFCQVTGYGGTPVVNSAGTTAASERTIQVRFDANVNKSLKWRFRPEQSEVTVKLGETALAFYKAENLSSETITGTATFNVTPYKAGPFFAKVDCFCFSEQVLKPGEIVEMPVSFYVDPEIFNDPNARDVHTITLSYTFFKAEEQAGRQDTDIQAVGAAAPTKG